MKKFIALSAIVIGVAGCSSSDDPTADLNSTLTNALLNGTWISSCITTNLDPGLGSAKVNATLSNGSGSVTYTGYSDNGCQTVTTTVPETFTYTLGIDVTVDGSVAGITTATQVNFIDTTPGAIPAGEESFDIYAIKDLITLYVGDDTGVNDGSTTALRPTQLWDIPFTKQ